MFLELTRIPGMPKLVTVNTDHIVYFERPATGQAGNCILILNADGQHSTLTVLEDYTWIKEKLGMAPTPPPKDEPLV